MSGITIASNSAGFEQRVRRALSGSLNGDLRRWKGDLGSADLRTVIGELTADGVDVIAVGPDVSWDAALRLAQEMDETRPEVNVVIVTEPGPGDVFEAALHAGVRDVLTTDVSDESLQLTLERAIEIADRRRRNLTEASGGGRAAGRVLTVVAPKGGSGKTAIATNLGVALAQAAPGEVALVDLDLLFGDVTSALDLDPEHTIADFMRSQGPRDITALKVSLTNRNDRLFVLCAPDSPEDGELVTESTVHRAIDLLASEFRYVVVDTAAGLNEHTLAALELSTDLIMVCDLSAAAVRGMQKVVGALDRLDMTTARRHFVLNRADSRVGLELTEVAATVGMPIEVKLPSARAVAVSMNEGIPLVESAPRSPFARRRLELQTRFVPVEATKARGFWKRSA